MSLALAVDIIQKSGNLRISKLHALVPLLGSVACLFRAVRPSLLQLASALDFSNGGDQGRRYGLERNRYCAAASGSADPRPSCDTV